MPFTFADGGSDNDYVVADAIRIDRIDGYDTAGRLERTTDFRGIHSVFTYDAFGRATQTRVLDKNDNPNAPALPPVALSTVDYDQHGNVQRLVIYDVVGLAAVPVTIPADPRSLITSHPTFVQVTEYQYDSTNQLVATIGKQARADGSNGDVSTRTSYDGAGRVRFVQDEMSRETELIYDVYGRLQETRLPNPDDESANDRSTTTREYDAVGNVIALIDPNGHRAEFAYDLRDRRTASIDALGNVTRTLYDAVGQVVGTIDALGQAIFASYDDRGRLKLQSLADPDGAGPLAAPQTSYEYDAAGNISSMTSANGYRTSYQYDSLNRLTKEISTDVRIYEDPGVAAITDDDWVRVADSEVSFWRDHTTVTGSLAVPAAHWSITNQAAGTYRIAITWDGEAGLDANATAQAVAYNADGYVTWTGVLKTANQTADPFNFRTSVMSYDKGDELRQTQSLDPRDRGLRSNGCRQHEVRV